MSLQPEGPLRGPGLQSVHELSSPEFLLGRETHRSPEEVAPSRDLGGSEPCTGPSAAEAVVCCPGAPAGPCVPIDKPQFPAPLGTRGLKRAAQGSPPLLRGTPHPVTGQHESKGPPAFCKLRTTLKGPPAPELPVGSAEDLLRLRHSSALPNSTPTRFLPSLPRAWIPSPLPRNLPAREATCGS